jgi:transcriptional regulator with XRE-family HTH domain
LTLQCNHISHQKTEVILRNVAKKLKELSETKNLSQFQVYDDTKIHIGRIEAGNTNIKLTTLIKLCNYYNISLSSFFEGK